MLHGEQGRPPLLSMRKLFAAFLVYTMALYAARFTAIVTIEIPVYARTEDEVKRYLEGTDEWRDDASFTFEDYHCVKSISFSGISRITDPKNSHFEPGVLCWNGHELKPTEVGQACYGLPAPPNRDDYRNQDEFIKAWNDYYKICKSLSEKYKAERNSAPPDKK